jgi:uncharacterized protein (TIGR02391 family)
MSDLTTADKQYLENALRMSDGYVLNFSDKTFKEFFQNDLHVDIYDDKYAINGTSKANRLRTFFQLENNQLVGKSIICLACCIRNMELLGANVIFSKGVMEIGQRLMNMSSERQEQIQSNQKVDITKESFIEIHPDIFNHIKSCIENRDYYHAVEEAYKVVIEKLREITGEEQASKAFNDKNYNKIFGKTNKTLIEKDFCDGIKHLCLAIQKFRNNTVHSLSKKLDKNIAMHYISLTSLAYSLLIKYSSLDNKPQ